MFWALSQNYQHSFEKQYMYAFYGKLSKEVKNGTEILVGQAVLKLWIKTVKILFGSITQEPLGLPKFTIRCIYYFSKRH